MPRWASSHWRLTSREWLFLRTEIWLDKVNFTRVVGNFVESIWGFGYNIDTRSELYFIEFVFTMGLLEERDPGSEARSDPTWSVPSRLLGILYILHGGCVMHLAFFAFLSPLPPSSRRQVIPSNVLRLSLKWTPLIDYKAQIGTKVYTGLLGVVSIPIPNVVAILAHELALVKRFLLELQPLNKPMSLKDPILHLDLGPQPRNQGKDHRIGD